MSGVPKLDYVNGHVEIVKLILALVYITRDYWALSIVRYSEKYKISEIGCVSVQKWNSWTQQSRNLPPFHLGTATYPVFETSCSLE
jgi:hypothetical protein